MRRNPLWWARAMEEPLRVLSAARGVRDRGEETNGALTVFENVIPPGQGPPLHVHATRTSPGTCWPGISSSGWAGTPSGNRGVVRVCAAGHAAFFVNSLVCRRASLSCSLPAGMERFLDEFAGLDGADADAFRKLGEPVGMTAPRTAAAAQGPR